MRFGRGAIATWMTLWLCAMLPVLQTRHVGVGQGSLPGSTTPPYRPSFPAKVNSIQDSPFWIYYRTFVSKLTQKTWRNRVYIGFWKNWENLLGQPNKASVVFKNFWNSGLPNVWISIHTHYATKLTFKHIRQHIRLFLFYSYTYVSFFFSRFRSRIRWANKFFFCCQIFRSSKQSCTWNRRGFKVFLEVGADFENIFEEFEDRFLSHH